MKIFIILFLCFTVIPVVELTLLIRLSHLFSFFAVLALTISTGIIGASLAKSQGRQTLLKAQNNLKTGQVPTKEILDGILIIIAAVVLVTPGILTDLFGFSILLPPIRAIYRTVLLSLFKGVKASPNVHFTSSTSSHFQQGPHRQSQDPNDVIIDAEAEEVNDHKQLH